MFRALIFDSSVDAGTPNLENWLSALGQLRSKQRVSTQAARNVNPAIQEGEKMSYVI